MLRFSHHQGQYQLPCILFTCHVMVQPWRQPPWGSYGGGRRRITEKQPVGPPWSHEEPRGEDLSLKLLISMLHGALDVPAVRCSSSTLGQGSKIMLAIYLLIKAVLQAWGLYLWRHQERAMLIDSIGLCGGTIFLSSLFWILIYEGFGVPLIATLQESSRHCTSIGHRDSHCPVCLQTANFPVSTNCGHLFCGNGNRTHTDAHTSQGSSLIIDLWIIE